MRKQGSNSKLLIPTKRIKFERQDHLMLSKVFSNERQVVRLILNTDNMTFQIVDVLTGYVYDSGGDNINNLEVLQRNAKKRLEKFLDANFMIEKKKTSG